MPYYGKKAPLTRKIVRRNAGRSVWEGKNSPLVSFRDLSLLEDGDVWAEMLKVRFEIHGRVDNVICRREAEVELTDISCQVDLIQGTGGIGFSDGGDVPHRRRGLPNSSGQASSSCRTCS